MAHRIFEIFLSLGAARWLLDGARFLFARFRKRVTADLYIAYYDGLSSAGPTRKSTFVVIRNETDRKIKVDMFLWEDRCWTRWLNRRPMRQPYVVKQPIVEVPPREGRQLALTYTYANVLDPAHRYFGVRLSTGKAIWVKTRRWRRALREFKRDFPDWAAHPNDHKPVQLQQYPLNNPSMS